MITLTEKVLLSAMQGSRNVYPNEFIALFRRSKQRSQSGQDCQSSVVDELVIPPFSEYNAASSGFPEFHLPPMQIAGSFHSHPNGSGAPSQQDLLFFSKMGDFHIVAFPPFALDSFKAYSNNGKRIAVALK